MKRDLHSKINMRPQLVKAIIDAAKVKGDFSDKSDFILKASIRANRMMLFY
jgi:hypothetical protein